MNESGEPVPHERYEIIAPDGETIRRGALDQNGWARAAIPTSGTCQVSFPNLDAAAWQRGTGAPGASNAAGEASPPTAVPAAQPSDEISELKPPPAASDAFEEIDDDEQNQVGSGD